MRIELSFVTGGDPIECCFSIVFFAPIHSLGREGYHGKAAMAFSTIACRCSSLASTGVKLRPQYHDLQRVCGNILPFDCHE